VDALVSGQGNADNLLADFSPLESINRPMAPPSQRLGPYELISPLGKGGMGEV
jgi:hypothetical protein